MLSLQELHQEASVNTEVIYMVLMGIMGELGAGKTLCLTYFALRNYHKQRQLFMNYHLKKLPYTYVKSPEDILNMRDGFAGLDELWTWADSRISSSKKNKFITLVLAKSRKRGINICYSVQYFKSVDIRIRTVTDFLVLPRLNEKETVCSAFVYTNHGMQLQRVFKFKTAPIFDLYDTKEEVEEFEMK